MIVQVDIVNDFPECFVADLAAKIDSEHPIGTLFLFLEELREI
jgi:hypothetical protein